MSSATSPQKVASTPTVPRNKAVQQSGPATNKPSKQSKPHASTTETPSKAKRGRHRKAQGTPKMPSAKALNGDVAAPVSGGKDTNLKQHGKDGDGKKQKDLSKKRTKKEERALSRPPWRLSPYLAGRYLRIDPLFSQDEKHIFLAHTNTLEIFSVKTSLLVRSITLPKSSRSDETVSYFLDPHVSSQVYVATSRSRLFLWSWTTGQLVCSWDLRLGILTHLVICADEQMAMKDSERIVYATGGDRREKLWQVRLRRHEKPAATVIAETTLPITIVQIHASGSAVCISAGKEILVINKARDGGWLAPRRYFVEDGITCMDVNFPDRPSEQTQEKRSKKNDSRRGDIVVGNKIGALYVFQDVVRPPANTSDPIVRKLHWHRTAAHAVKWALEGSYIISGGTETVMVLWQIETGVKQFLPNLGSTIENIVVSPKGGFYALSLADNSTMVLSTTELKPKANIAGIQSTTQPANSAFKAARVPCVLHPTLANNLLIATPSIQSDRRGQRPYLQTFDTFSNRHISRQALTRTTATTINQAPDHSRIAEPNITHLAITADGEWLASVDMWERQSGSDDLHAASDRHREIFLRFWKWSNNLKEWELVTRVDFPHPSVDDIGSEQIVDLIAAPRGHMFVTAGADGSVKIWKAKIRTRAGVPVQGEKGELTNWSCKKVVNFARPVGTNELLISASNENATEIAPAQKRANPFWGSVALSEDNSVLAVAAPTPSLGAKTESVIHLIDARSGHLRHSLDGLCVGRTTAIAIVGRCLVILGTSKLLLWDLVDGGVQSEYSVQDIGVKNPDTTMHLAVDLQNKTFAVGFSATERDHRVAIFTPTAFEPVHIESLRAPISALRAAGAGKGYMILDNQARVQYLSSSLAPHVSVVHAFKDLDLSLEDDEELSGSYKTGSAATELAIRAPADALRHESEDEEEDGVVERVVPREALGHVFDVPAYAAGPMEDAFSQVYDLFAKKALRDDSEDEEEILDRDRENTDEIQDGEADEDSDVSME